ncbi:outer membrane beta-barrel protein [Myxococcota bacterium]|nr:outer membrane beta-barrel protein [Myxococcota bacterium]
MGQVRIGSGIAALVGILVFAAGDAAAEWKLYLQGGIGLSGAEVETDGQAGNQPVTPLVGSDHDSSPMLDAAVGLEVPMDELVPREFLLKVRLPDWPVRTEIEAAGLREWEFSTVAGAGNNAERFFTELKATTVLFNQWLDIPMVSVAKPFQYLFGLGRQPRLRRWLEPASLYVGAGVGLTALMDIDGTSNVIGAHDDVVDFAWNVGTGFNFQMTERVSLSAGYRYVGLPNPSVSTQGPFTPGPGSKVDYDLHVHELRIGVRVRVFEFASPWR